MALWWQRHRRRRRGATASEGTGSENRDAHLRSADSFNVETYSEIQYVSSAIVNVDLVSRIVSS
ncbi:YceI family protein [Brevibacterium sp. H-BE7]|uniref:YceI family protein n=1 Tax=unclassified Brevibacterium TaxID=2614124 RepID=UPI00330792FE